MKVNREVLRKEIEDIIAQGVIDGEEIDVTSENVMQKIELLIRAAELATN